jgi:hypothetical protein
MLGDRSPLLPESPGRRVALYRCSCGEAGCGVVAPVVVPSPDGRRVSWVDFRDFVGVFAGPEAPGGDRPDGRPWPIEELHFDRAQYVAEVERAGADRSWETPRRITARLVGDGLRARGPVLPPDLQVNWAAPSWAGDGVMISFVGGRPGGGTFVQRLLNLTSTVPDPEAAARDVLDQLAAVPAGAWYERFGWQRR